MLTFCALLVLAPSRLPLIWEHATPLVRAMFSVPLLLVLLQVLAFATHRGWLMVLGAVVSGLVALASLFIGGLSLVIAAFSGNRDVLMSFLVVGVYGAVVACHLALVFARRQTAEVAVPTPPRTL